MHLAANYLRAPITLLIGSSEALAETVKDDIIVNLQAVTMSLQSKVAHIMQQVEHSQGLSASAPLAKTVDETPLIRSSHFWIPIMVGAILALVTDFVMARLGDLDNSLVTYAIQTVIFVVLACLFYLVLSLVYRSSQQRSSKKALINQQENELKTARHTLMSEAATTLDEDLISLEKILPMLPQDATELQLLAEGTRRLRQIITTFKLLLQVENLPVDASGSETFDAVGLNNIISKAVHQSSTQIAAKELTLIQPSPNMISVPGSPELLQYVVSSILANATSFSPQHATVTMVATSNAQETRLTIQDQGEGIAPTQLGRLFEPFAKAGEGDALELNHDGLGLSLYLDRIIMKRFGGSITASSVVGHGTTITLKWPPVVRAISPSQT